MPNTNERVLFGADFDPAGFTKGVSTLITSLTSVSAKTDALNSDLAQTEAALTSVEGEIKKTSATLSTLDKSAKDYTTTSAGLKSKLDELVTTNNNISVGYRKQQEELAKSKKVFEDVSASQKKMADSMKAPITVNVAIAGVTEVGTKLQQLKNSFNKSFDSPAAFLDTSELDALDAKILSAKGEFQEIGAVVDALSQKLLQLEPGTQEFEDITAAVQAGNAVLSEYTNLYNEATKAVSDSEPKYKSIRTRLQELRNELTRLEEAGQDETEQYRETQLAAARLTDQYGDMQQQIRILASDTKNLDFGLGVLNAAATGFQTFTGAMELFGLSGNAAAEAQKKLLAVMALVQGAQQLQNLLLKEGVIRTVGAEIATKAYAASQRVLTVVLGASAAASRTLQTALIATGVGALVVALGFLVSKIIEWTSSTKDAAAAQEQLNKEIEHQNELLNSNLENIDFETKLRNAKLKERGLSEASIYESNQKGIKDKLAAYNQELANLNDQYGKTEVNNRGVILKQIYKLEADRQKLSRDLDISNAEERAKIAEDGRKKLKAITDKHIQDEKAAVELLRQIRLELSELGKTDEEKELLKLQLEYEKRINVLKKGGQDISTEVELYNKQVVAIHAKYSLMRIQAERELMDELERLNFDAANRRIENLSSEFDREKAAILLEQDKARAELQANQTNLLNQALKDRTEGLITDSTYQNTVKGITDVFNRLFDEVDENTAIKLNALGGKAVQNAINALQKGLAISTNSSDIGKNEEISFQNELLEKGKINYDQYQKALNEIAYRRGQERIQITRAALEAEIRLVNQRLLGNITKEEKEALISQLSDLNKQLSDLDVQQQQAQTEFRQKTRTETAEHLNLLLTTYQNFAGSVLGFLSDIEKAEAARLDRSIALQQKRVDNAREVATKGNAEYLELEQKRLDELTRKREENARKQLAIDNALRVSQTLVAAISATANAASQGGVIPAIAAGAAIIAAIAAIYSFVSQLQAPSAEFWEGSEYVTGTPGRDKINAKVSRGEAIIPVDRNEKYHESVKAIYRQTVPPEVLNYFVTSYQQPHFPSVDYSRLGRATDRHMTSKDGNGNEISSRLDKLNESVLHMANKLDKLDNVSMSFDENGFAISVIKAYKYESLKFKS